MQDTLYEAIRDYDSSVFYCVGQNPSFSHFHQQLELLYVEHGNVRVDLNDKTLNLKEGDLIIVNCFDTHQYFPEADTITRCLTIPVQYLKHYMSVLKNRSLDRQYFTDKLIVAGIKKAMLDVVSHLEDNELILDGYIQILLGTIVKNNLIAQEGKASLDLIKNILLYIEKNFAEHINLDTISKHFGYSKYYFSHLFNKYFRCNLNDYLNLVRCRYAISYVIDESMSVNKAAFACGFESMRTFYRIFKKYFGITPKEYFKKCKEDNKDNK